MSYKILVINPGSTSTKIALYFNENEVFSETIRHSREELSRYPNIPSQYEFRMNMVLSALERHNYKVEDLDAVVGRGGLLYPLESGTYRVNDKMCEHLRIGVQGEHASNLGGLISKAIAEKTGIPAFIVDPVIVDELEPVARISGCPLIPRRSIFHALNHKAVARKVAKSLGKKYEEVNLIVAHLGGGISVAAHRRGRVVDVNNALDGDGPFAPERSGGLPVGDLVRLCFSGKYTMDEIMDMIRGKGGMVAYTGTNDMRIIGERAKAGDKQMDLLIEAMAYQVAKEIGGLATALEGHIDQIVLTGGIANNEDFTSRIVRRVKFLAPVTIVPGEEEMQALALGALRVLTGEERAKEYNPLEEK